MIQQKKSKRRREKKKIAKSLSLTFSPKNSFILLRDILIAIVNVAKIRSINIA
jgi:hypothetical protein